MHSHLIIITSRHGIQSCSQEKRTQLTQNSTRLTVQSLLTHANVEREKHTLPNTVWRKNCIAN